MRADEVTRAIGAPSGGNGGTACGGDEHVPRASTKHEVLTVRSMCGVRLTNRASAAGAGLAGAPCARSFYPTPPAHKRNSSLLGRARLLQALG